MASPSFEQSAVALRPLLEECGYRGSRLATNYKLNDISLPLVGFAGKPWDFDSACVAVLDSAGDVRQAVRSCYDLAAPVVWVRHSGSVDWWVQHATEPTLFASRPLGDFPAFVRQHQDELGPASIYRGKTIARVDKTRQLAFVDVGLMPLRREEAGQKLGDLIEEMTRRTLDALGRRSPSKAILHQIYIYVFRLLAAKILKDKAVAGFVSLDLAEPASAITAVSKHYDTANPPVHVDNQWRTALKPAASLCDGSGSFAVVSPETLAYIYEHTLVTPALRRKLGIHATPPWLVDYIVWNLYDWIRDIPQTDRHVFEPACGHAPFLLSAMRLLRLELQDEPEKKVHAYLQNHIHGVEADSFAREIARLSLTLADIPNPDGWDLKPGDMYASSILSEEAAKCRVLLSNPPYERFKPEEKQEYASAGFPVRHRKAIELLDRTLPHLVPGAVFGVVVPQGVLHNTAGRELRDFLIKECEFRELCLFADKVFEWSDAETVILIGRRRVPSVKRQAVVIRRVREDSVAQFAESYKVDAEQRVPQNALGKDEGRNLRLPDLPEVWDHLSRYPKVSDVADVGQGFSFAEKGLIDRARGAGKHKTADAVPAFLSGVHSLSIWQTPESAWLSPSRTPVVAWRSGQRTGQPQVLVNYSPVMRGPWRIKALLDVNGHAVTNTYTTVRSRENGPPAVFLWAIFNSPIANAYVYCNALKRHIYDSLVASMPLPFNWPEHVEAIIEAANNYLLLVREHESFQLAAQNNTVVCEALLKMDAAVMRAYALPAKRERGLLDLFNLPEAQTNRRRRKGVGCAFGDYFPKSYGSSIPLWRYISDTYQRSTPDDVLKSLPTVTDPELLEALREAE